jgi:hypothetical protein
MRETPIRWLDGGGGSDEKRLGLGWNRTGKASIYRGFQSTRSQGELWENLGLNWLEIVILEIGFDRGSKLSEMMNSARLGIRHGRSERVARAVRPPRRSGLACWAAWAARWATSWATGKQREEGGRGWLQGKTEFWPKANIKNSNVFHFPNLFIKANQFWFNSNLNFDLL